MSDPVRPQGRPDSSRRPDYEALAHREGPVPESAAGNILSYLLAGLLGFGLPAWLLDQWLGTRWIVLVGILAGTAVAMLTIWVRYGTGETGSPGPSVRGTTPSTDSVSGASRPSRGSRPQDRAGRAGAPSSAPLHDQPHHEPPHDAAPAPDASPLEDKP